jgi:hypothetical protein
MLRVNFSQRNAGVTGRHTAVEGFPWPDTQGMLDAKISNGDTRAKQNPAFTACGL